MSDTQTQYSPSFNYCFQQPCSCTFCLWCCRVLSCREADNNNAIVVCMMRWDMRHCCSVTWVLTLRLRMTLDMASVTMEQPRETGVSHRSESSVQTLDSLHSLSQTVLVWVWTPASAHPCHCHSCNISHLHCQWQYHFHSVNTNTVRWMCETVV